MGSPVRVAIVEDDKELRDLLPRRVERAENMRVTASFASGDDFLERLKDLEADVVLMDINMPGRNGIGTVREAKQQRPEVQYLMLTIFENPAFIFEALCAGATGYLLKSTTAEELLDAIRDIHKGGSPMNSTIARLVVNSFQKETQQRFHDEQLSDREKQVPDGLASGLQYKEIADKLAVNISTIRTRLLKRRLHRRQKS